MAVPAVPLPPALQSLTARGGGMCPVFPPLGSATDEVVAVGRDGRPSPLGPRAGCREWGGLIRCPLGRICLRRHLSHVKL